MNTQLHQLTQDLEQRTEELALALRASGHGVAFLLGYLTMWRDSLGGVPRWLRLAGQRCRSDHPQLGQVMYRNADLEETKHFVALAQDLAELCEHPHWARQAAIFRPTAESERHIYIRTAISGTDIYQPLALECYHAVLDRVFSPVLLSTLRAVIPWELDLRRFVESRNGDAPRRAHESALLLSQAAEHVSDRKRVADWHATARLVIDSYLDAVQSLVSRVAGR